MNDAKYYLLSALAAIIALTVHEYAHGYVAYRLGDDTAKNSGRLSLNPVRHLDPIGALCMVFFHVGWARPVPINPRYFKNPKRGFALSALAGPLSNIILGFLGGGLYLLTYALLRDVSFPSQNLAYNLATNLLLFLFVFHSVNIGLGVFNLLPLPPFDGSRLLNVLLPEKVYFGVMKYERQIYLGVLGWLLLGDVAKRALLSVPFIAESPVLSTVAGIFSLSDLLSLAIGELSSLIMRFWQLIPFLA
jgi:Zn-dependent protease